MYFAFEKEIGTITQEAMKKLQRPLFSYFRLRSPQEGLFMGAVDAYDTSNNTYRIRFDRPGLGGTHSVRDEEVLSVEPPETVPLSSFIPQRVARPKPPQVSHPGLLLSSGNNSR